MHLKARKLGALAQAVIVLASEGPPLCKREVRNTAVLTTLDGSQSMVLALDGPLLAAGNLEVPQVAASVPGRTMHCCC